jgi:hypothetical protein
MALRSEVIDAARRRSGLDRALGPGGRRDADKSCNAALQSSFSRIAPATTSDVHHSTTRSSSYGTITCSR